MTRTELKAALNDGQRRRPAVNFYAHLTPFMKTVLCERYKPKYAGLGYNWQTMTIPELREYLVPGSTRLENALAKAENKVKK